MVKKSKKSKSKRITLKKKHKVIKKVKEHHKKKAKEAKKLGLGKRSKVEKDPGIPNDWPFKEQELKALEERRARAVDEIEQKKAARKERRQKRKLGLLDEENASDKEMEEADTKTNNNAAATGKNRDTSDRAFYKELVKVIEASDVILEVLDARDPLGTRCADMENLVLKSGPGKHLVLLLNKIDLVPRESAEKWLKYLREELPAVAFKCSTQEQRSNLGWKSSKPAKPSSILQTSDCLGADTLIKLLKNYSRSHEIKKSITVGVIGLPNVGKSSLINSLKRAHVANVGSTPGLTRTLQEVQLDRNVKLLDCPGVVMLRSSDNNNSAIALKNCKRIEKLEDPVTPVKEILKLCPEKVLVSIYKIPTFDSVDDFLQKVASVRGKLKKGGIVDVEAAAKIVLHDWNEGKIPYYTMPPSRDQGEAAEAKIVTALAKEFNIDEVYNTESSFIGSLKSVDDFQQVEVPPSNPLNFDETMLEENVEPEVVSKGDKDGDEAMTNGEDEVAKPKAQTTSRKQNEKLYVAEGILNPNAKRAEKKKRKKAKLSSNNSMDEDYDFKVDYAKNGSADESDGEDDEIVAEIPMAGVELDEQ